MNLILIITSTGQIAGALSETLDELEEGIFMSDPKDDFTNLKILMDCVDDLNQSLMDCGYKPLSFDTLVMCFKILNSGEIRQIVASLS